MRGKAQGTCCLSNILQNAAQTSYQEPSPVSPAVSRSLCTTETDRPPGSSMLQTSHCGRRGGQGRQLAGHLAGEAELGTKPQRHFCPQQKETIGLGPKASETSSPCWIGPLARHKIMAVELQEPFRVQVSTYHPACHLGPNI